ncbi:MAG: 50S ribosomal protein L39e [Candidatus Micrarchaeia archaeon]|jgi:large subunit ribosomal protein L39e
MVKKNLRKKLRLGKKTRQNRRIPTFVAIRTKRKVQNNTKTRTWRTEKIGKSEKE